MADKPDDDPDRRDAPSPPLSDGTPAAVTPVEPSQRSKRLTDAAVETMSAGVSLVGIGVDKIGDTVTKIGEASKGVPIVGPGIHKLGESLSQVGESMQELPRVTSTRRGRLLVRSLVVGFVLVATWIAVIVALQIKSSDAPDFRPIAEDILVKLSSGTAGIEDVYDNASPRFQEMARKEKFVDEMNDLHATVGPFKEIASINDTLVTTGPTGRVGRISLTVAYEKANCRASVSVHEDKGVWKFLGVGVELPAELEISQAQREERVAACKDNMSRSCDLFVAATKVLEMLRDGHAGMVWDDASPVFQKQEERARFIQIQDERALILGAFIRIISVSEAKIIGGTSATFDTIAEYARANGVRATFTFFRVSKLKPWKLRSLKIVLPMPRADEQLPFDSRPGAIPPDALPDGPPGD